MSAHLGRALTAYVDGELDHARREEVQVHLAHCATCRKDLAELRQLKEVLRGPSGPLMPSDLAARVLAATTPMGHPQPVPRPRVARRPSVIAHHRIRRTAIGAGLVVIGLGGAFMVAGSPPGDPVAPVDPTSSGLVIEHVSTAHEVPFTGANVVPVSAPAPVR